MMDEPPSKCATIYHKTAGRFVSFKALLVIVTALWLWQSFLWGGMYLGCGLAVAVSVAGMAGLVLRDYISQGSLVSRYVSVVHGYTDCSKSRYAYPVLSPLHFSTLPVSQLNIPLSFLRLMRFTRSNVRGIVRLFADVIMIASVLAALWGVGAEAFCLTVFFVVWILRIALPVATRWLESDPDTVIYFAPWVSPFLVEASKNDRAGWVRRGFFRAAGKIVFDVLFSRILAITLS